MNIWVVLLLLWPATRAAFVVTFQVGVLNALAVAFQPFVVYVALDTRRLLLKFLSNTLIHLPDANASEPIVTDVNHAKNRYTTLHVVIDFLGKKVVLESLRLCEVVAVKNIHVRKHAAFRARHTKCVR